MSGQWKFANTFLEKIFQPLLRSDKTENYFKLKNIE